MWITQYTYSRAHWGNLIDMCGHSPTSARAVHRGRGVHATQRVSGHLYRGRVWGVRKCDSGSNWRGKEKGNGGMEVGSTGTESSFASIATGLRKETIVSDSADLRAESPYPTALCGADPRGPSWPHTSIPCSSSL